jgi:predicted RNA-binding protein with PUA-like domain
MAKQYWLMKSEPNTYSIADLKRDGQTYWDGVRNYQARNFMRDQMRVGDEVLYYHSNADPPGVAGVAKISVAAYPDFTAWDKSDAHHDPKSDPDKPTWYMVELEFVEQFAGVVSLETLKNTPELDGMLVTKRGQRLSVQPVEPQHFRAVRKLGRELSKSPRA